MGDRASSDALLVEQADLAATVFMLAKPCSIWWQSCMGASKTNKWPGERNVNLGEKGSQSPSFQVLIAS